MLTGIIRIKKELEEVAKNLKANIKKLLTFNRPITAREWHVQQIHVRVWLRWRDHWRL